MVSFRLVMTATEGKDEISSNELGRSHAINQRRLDWLTVILEEGKEEGKYADIRGREGDHQERERQNKYTDIVYPAAHAQANDTVT